MEHFECTVGGDFDRNVGLEFLLELDRAGVRADAAERSRKAHGAHIDRVSGGDEGVGDVALGDRAVKNALIVAAADELDRNSDELLHGVFALRALRREFSDRLCARFLQGLDLRVGWMLGERVGQKVVAGVAGAHLDDVTNDAEVFDVSEKKQFDWTCHRSLSWGIAP